MKRTSSAPRHQQNSGELIPMHSRNEAIVRFEYIKNSKEEIGKAQIVLAGEMNG